GTFGSQETVTNLRIYGRRGAELLAMVAAPPGHRLSLYNGHDILHMGWANGAIHELASVYLDGQPHLLAFGAFTTFAGAPADGIICLDAAGEIVEPPFERPPGLLKIEAAHVELTPGGPLVYLAGPSARSADAYGYARYWNGEWRSFQDECDGPIDSIRLHHHEGGSDLWLLGRFERIGATSAL